MCVTWMCILLMQSVYVVSWVQEDKKLDYWLGTFKFSSVQTLLSNKMIVTHFKESFIITIVIIKISINYKKKGFSSVKLLQPGHSLSSCLSVSSPKHQWHHHHHQCMATVHCALQWRPHTYRKLQKEFSCETLSATQPPIQSINWCSTKEASSSMATVVSPYLYHQLRKRGSAVKLLLTA